jgi:hypothetical protein
MPSSSATNRRSFLARGAAIAAVPAIATLAGGAIAEPALADDTLPDYAPIPPSALGPAVNARGYFVGRVKKNLYWVTDSTYQAAFLTTKDGVVLFDAPPRPKPWPTRGSTTAAATWAGSAPATTWSSTGST